MSEPTGARRYGVGGGDAYYDAVKYGGYEGTREQFGKDQAEFAKNASAVAEAKEAVERDAEEVRNTKNTFENTTVPEAIQALNQEGEDQILAITQKGEEVSQQVETVGTEQKDAVANEGRARVEAVEQAGTTQVQAVNDAGTTQVGNVNQAGADQIGAVERAGANQVQAVTDEGTTQVRAVTDEGNTQVQRVQDKGDEVLDSIPADYTNLDQKVDNLEGSLKGIYGNPVNLPFSVTLGSIDAGNGSVLTSSVFGYTDYIEVSHFDYIRYKLIENTNSDVKAGLAFYDINKEFICGIQMKKSQPSTQYASELEQIAIPDNAVFCRATTLYNTETYGLFEIIGISLNERKYLEIRPACPFVQTGIIGFKSGSVGSNAFNCVSDYVYCRNFDLIKYTRIYLLSTGNAGLCFYDENKTAINRNGVEIGISDIRETKISYCIIPPEAYYVRFTYPLQTNIVEYSLPDFDVKLIKYNNEMLFANKPITYGAENVIKRAKQLTNFKWKPLNDITRMVMELDGTISRSKFIKGIEYIGTPYSVTQNRVQNLNVEKFIDIFASAIENDKTRIYDTSLSTFNSYTYYGNVCSSFLCSAFGLKTAPLTEVMPTYDAFELKAPKQAYTVESLNICDILLEPSSHVVLVTGIMTDVLGKINLIEISEATLSGYLQGGKAISTWYTPAQFMARFAGYDLYKCKYTDSTIYYASNNVNTGNESELYIDNTKECYPIYGNGCVINQSNSTLPIIIDSDAYSLGYTSMKIYKNGELFNEYEITASTETISVSNSAVGKYRAFLVKDGEISSDCEWEVIGGTFSKSLDGTTLTIVYSTDSIIYGIGYTSDGKKHYINVNAQNGVTGEGTIIKSIESDASSIELIIGNKLTAIHMSI